MTEQTCNICADRFGSCTPAAPPASPRSWWRPRTTTRASTATSTRAATAARCTSPGCRAGEELAELYRGMSDEAYLSEEAGRRETAGRLLDLIQQQVPAGSLLDVGCGHGLLLDEARRRGFTVTGLELSQAAARATRATSSSSTSASSAWRSSRGRRAGTRSLSWST